MTRPSVTLLLSVLISSLASSCGGGDDDSTTADAASDDGNTPADAAGDVPDGAGGTSDAPAAARVGDPCESAADCPAGGTGTTVCLTDGFPGGYCAVQDCGDHSHDCPDDLGQATTGEGAKCVLSPTNLCAKVCAGNDDCRDGYTCQAMDDAAGHATVMVCWPA